MSAPVVSNAGPLMVLAKLNLLHLLQELYGRVYIVHSVYEEAVTAGMRQGYEDAVTLHLFLHQTGWEPEEIDPAEVPGDLREAPLDQGERDTLALAARLGSTVLMDEAVGRDVARRRGLAVHGSLGVLVESYRRGLISADQLRLYLAEMARRNDIWISRALIDLVRREVLGSSG